jgi:hypothetical protein
MELICRQLTQAQTNLLDHGSKLAAEGTDLAERLFEDRRERQETQGVTCRGSVEYNDRKLH